MGTKDFDCALYIAMKMAKAMITGTIVEAEIINDAALAEIAKAKSGKSTKNAKVNNERRV